MFKLIRLTVSVLLLAGVAAAHDRYKPINTTDFATNPETIEGRLVEVRANIIAISADAKSIELFDAQRMITVRLTQLRKSQRSALIHSPVRQLLVYGQATLIRGRLVIDAHRVEALPLEATVKV